MSYLPYLSTFLAVYRCGSITAAARLVGLTQPAASSHVKTLETHVGQRLFERKRHGVTPTAAAHELARAVAEPLDALEATLLDGRRGARGIAGTVRLGGPAEFIGERVLPALTPLIARGIKFRVQTGLADDVLAALERADLDVAVSTVPARRRGVDHQLIYREEFVLIGAPQWAKNAGTRAKQDARYEYLRALPLLAYAEGLPIVRRYFKHVFARKPDRIAAVVIPDLRAIVAAVAAGMGVSVVPRYLCQRQLERGEVIELHRPEAPPSNQIHLAWNKTAVRQPRVALVRDTLLNAAARWNNS
jgi:DNA-binding transcriptional LysR family regulator